MKICRGILFALMLWVISPMSIADDLPPPAREVLAHFESQVSEIDKQFEAEAQKWRNKTARDLKAVQDLFCKEARLDEAVAIRDVITGLRAGSDRSPGTGLPPAALEIMQQHETEVGEILRIAEAEVHTWREKASAQLKSLQDQFCREAKLDEAVAVRNLIRAIHGGVINVEPDPGYVNNSSSDIGRVFYYEVTGVTTGGSLYGTGIFTTGSHLGMAAVHSGVLKAGQKGVVKVTILPGEPAYLASTKYGVTSYAYGRYSVSFKVERVYGFAGKLSSARLVAPLDSARPPIRKH